MTFNYQKLNFYNNVQKRIRQDILEITIQYNVEISQPQRAERTSRNEQEPSWRKRRQERGDRKEELGHAVQSLSRDAPCSTLTKVFRCLVYLSTFSHGFNSFKRRDNYFSLRSHWVRHFLPQKQKELAKRHRHLLQAWLLESAKVSAPSD